MLWEIFAMRWETCVVLVQRRPGKKSGLNAIWSRELACAIAMHIDSPSELSIRLMHGNRVGHWFKSCNCISLSFHSDDLSNMTHIKFYSSTQTRKVFLSSSLHFWSKLTCDGCKHNIIYFYAESIIISGNWTVISKYPAFKCKLFTHSNHLRNVYRVF